jgi:hypothetical protein
LQSDELPEGALVFHLPNVGRNDHTIAFWMSMIQYSSQDNEVVVFLKDNLDIHQSSRARSLRHMLRITAKTGYACFQEPSQGMSQFHRTEVLTTLNMTGYDGVAKYLEDGTEVVNSNRDFKSKYQNMGDWIARMNITLPAALTPVCYGGIFAVKVSHISSVPSKVWTSLETSLSRGDNIEEGHFAERTWAALLSKPLGLEQANKIMSHAHHTNHFVATDGGGHLGALVAFTHSWQPG